MTDSWYVEDEKTVKELDRDKIEDGDVLGLRVDYVQDEPHLWIDLSHRCRNGYIGLSLSELKWLVSEMEKS